MNKHAYLIIAHHNFEQLKYLINLLEYECNDIFIHIDKRVSDECVKDLEMFIQNEIKESFVKMIERIKVYWGGPSQINVELMLFAEAKMHHDYSYYHLISGDDLPLKNIRDIYRFFEDNPKKIFLTEVSDEIFAKNDIYDRVKYKYFLPNISSRGFRSRTLCNIIDSFRKIEKLVQSKMKIDNFKRHNVQIGYGSNWISLDDETVKILLDDQNWIRNAFKNAIVADELLLPTLINKHNLKDKIYHKEKINDLPEDFQGNLRYINWWDGSPYVWTDSIKDIQQLEYALTRGHLFSRKFDIVKYPQLKEYIDQKMNDRG